MCSWPTSLDAIPAVRRYSPVCLLPICQRVCYSVGVASCGWTVHNGVPHRRFTSDCVSLSLIRQGTSMDEPSQRRKRTAKRQPAQTKPPDGKKCSQTVSSAACERCVAESGETILGCKRQIGDYGQLNKDECFCCLQQETTVCAAPSNTKN